MKIHRIETGKVRIKENQIAKSKGIAPQLFKVMFGKKWAEWVPIFAWVIEHPEGIIIVDTGETHKTGTNGYLPKYHPYYRLAVEFHVKAEEEIGPQLRNLGIDPKKDVSKVILTHLHTDHAGGLYHFPNSEIIIEENEYNAASGLKGIVAGYLPHRWPKWLDPKLITLPYKPYFNFQQSMAVTSDSKVMIVSTPGHVANHISVIVEINGIYYFLAGDTSYTQENLLKIVPDGIGTVQSLSTLKNILSFSRDHPTVYLPSHDPENPERMDEVMIVPVYNNLPEYPAIDNY